MDKIEKIPIVKLHTDHECDGIYIHRIDNCPVCGFSHIENMAEFVKWWSTFGPEEDPEKWKDIGLIETLSDAADIAAIFFKGAKPVYLRHVPKEYDD
jgi:hypothetical protein